MQIGCVITFNLLYSRGRPIGARFTQMSFTLFPFLLLEGVGFVLHGAGFAAAWRCLYRTRRVLSEDVLVVMKITSSR